MTLIQQLQFEHFRGIHRVQRFIKYWTLLNTAKLLDATIYSHVSSKLNSQLTDGTKWANTFRTQFGACYKNQVSCDLEIGTPAAAAVTAEVGTNVNLSAALKTQDGTAVTDGTFNWSVVEPGATLSAPTGTTTVFSASKAGVYSVKLWDSRWPEQFEDEQIFVGDWANSSGTGIKTEIGKLALQPLKIIQMTRHVLINSPIAGKINIVSLQGRVMQSIFAGKAGTIVWNTKGAARGLYLIQVQNESQTLRSKFFIQ
jgi:hypothetical protein